MRKLLYISLLMLLFSCETVIDVELPKRDPHMVVNAVFTPEFTTPVLLSLSQSSMEGYSDYEVIEDATVEIFEGGTQLGSYTYSGFGKYEYAFTPTAGKKYTLKVNSTSRGVAESTFEIPEAVAIETVDLNYDEYYGDDDYISGLAEFSVTFTDPANELNYYVLGICIPAINKWEEDNIDGREHLHFDVDAPFDERVEGVNILYYNHYGKMFVDGAYDGEEITINGEVYIDSAPVTDLEFQLLSISEDLYKYLKSANQQYEIDGNPFIQPVTVFGNVEGGLGFVGGFSSSSISKTFR